MGVFKQVLEQLKHVLLEKLANTEWVIPKYFDSLWMDGLRVKAFSMLKPKPGWIVLDVGCGDGWSTIQNALVYDYVFFLGIDMYEAEEAYENAKLFNLSKCGFIQGDIYTVNFRRAFDVIMFFLSLGNICSGEKHMFSLFIKIKNFLKYKGKLLIVEPFQEDFEEFEKLDAIYEISGIKGIGEENETILGFKDVATTLKNVGFNITKITKYIFSWSVSKEEFLEYFGLKELPLRIKNFYFRDKPKKVTIIVARRQ